MRNGCDVGQTFRIPRGDLLPREEFGVENHQLLDKDSCLQGVQPTVHADAHDVVLIIAFAVQANAGHNLGKAFVISENRPAIAVATERLGGKKAGGCNVTKSADPLPALRCSERLRRVG